MAPFVPRPPEHAVHLFFHHPLQELVRALTVFACPATLLAVPRRRRVLVTLVIAGLGVWSIYLLLPARCMTEPTLLYVLSTLAQTCAALAAFVGAVGLFRLQVLRDHQNLAERNLRLAAVHVTSVDEKGYPLPVERVVDGIREARQLAELPANRDNKGYQANVAAAEQALARWQAFEPRAAKSRRSLIVFEAWNVVLIVVSLIAFIYVEPLALTRWTCLGLWLAALGTGAVTIYAVYAWTIGEDGWKTLLSRMRRWLKMGPLPKESNERIEQAKEAHHSENGRRWCSPEWIMAFATLGILAAAIITAVWQGVWIRRQWYTMEGQLVAANNALALTRQSNELSQRAWLVPIIADEYDPPAAVVTVRTKNSGRSPAFEVLTTYDGGNLPSEPQSATELRYRHFAGLVAADDVIAFKVKMSLEVRQGQRSYIYGKVTYRDAFTREPEAKPRETEFCRYYDPEIRRFGFCKGLNTAR